MANGIEQQGTSKDLGHLKTKNDVPIRELWCDWSRNPRDGGKRPRDANAAALSTLRESILREGLIEPVVCVEEEAPATVGKGNTAGEKGAKYRVIAGYRRFDALLYLANEAIGLDGKPDMETRARFQAIPIAIRKGNAFIADEETKNEKGETVFNRSIRLVSADTAEMMAAMAENELRSGLSPWDRMDVAVKLYRGGLMPKEISHVMTEQGVANASDVTISHYLGISTLPPKILSRLRPAGSEGWRVAKSLLSPKFYTDGAPTIAGRPKDGEALKARPWDENKLAKFLDGLMLGGDPAVSEEARKAAKKKAAKKAKWKVDAETIAIRLKGSRKSESIANAGKHNGNGPWLAAALTFLLTGDAEGLRKEWAGDDQDLFLAFTGEDYEPEEEEEGEE